MKNFRSRCCIQIPSRPFRCTGGWGQLITEKEILIVVASLGLVVQLRRTLLLHHSYTMWPIYCGFSSQLPLMLLPERGVFQNWNQSFFKENIRYPVWVCRDPIFLILGTRFSLIPGTRWYFSVILGTRFSILGTRIGSLKHL